MSAVAGVTALVGAVKSLTNAFKGALDNYAHFEKMEMGLTTFFQDAEKGKKQFEEIRKLSNETTFGVDELADSFTQLANVGVNTNTIKDKLVMLGNLASGDKAKFAELTSIYAKIQSTGKAGAMQLQQIASRGIPIYDILKKMGVQGSATGEQITKAFEQMTEEGGQFYNAMENINETIEGKEGFIADYFKEFTVNFAEVSGIADAYKNILDILKEKIGAVSDKLLEWNNNPIAKAILRGTLVAGVTALTVAIGVGLVGAISTLNKKLAITATLKAIINPTAVALTVGISAVLGLATALETATTQAGKYVDKIKEIQEEEKKNQYGLNDVDLEKAYKNKNKGTASTKELLAIARKEKSEAQINAQILKEQTTASGGAYWQSYVNAEKAVKAKEQEYNIIEKIYQREVGIFKADEKTVNAIKDQVTEFDDFVKKLGDAEKNYSSIFKKEQELKEVEKERQKYLDFVNKQFFGTEFDASGHRKALSLSKEQKEQYEKDLKEINKKYEELNIEVRIGNLSEVEQNLQKVLGLSNKEVYKLNPTKNDQTDWVEKYIQNYLNKQGVLTSAYKYAGINQGTRSKDYILQEAEGVKSMLEQLASINLEGKYNDAIESLKYYLDELKVEFINANGELIDFNIALNNVKESLPTFAEKLQKEATQVVEKYLRGEKLDSRDYGKYASSIGLSSASGMGGDAGNFLQTFSQTGNVFLALINTLVGSLVNVLKEVKGFEETLSPITRLFKQLKPSLEMIVEEVQYAEDTMNTVLKPLMGVINAIFKLLKPFSAIINAVVRVFFTAFGLFDSLCNWLEELGLLTKEETKSKEEELAKQKALTDAYNNMLSVLRDTQEEYEKRKKYINAQGYADSVTGVHDMILTPQGRFSTDPDDYIIATKNPSGLNGGKGDIIINNYSNAQVEAKQDDMGNTVILISQKVAMDYAQGNNGWDSAVQARQARMAGRSLAM